MLDTIFEHHFGGDEIIEIESLQIDLGTLPESGFNNEFRRRLTDLLNLEFEKIAKNSHKTAAGSIESSEVPPRLQLEAYLLNGYLRSGLKSLNDLFRSLLEEDPNGLAALLGGIQSSAVVRQRILNQVDIELIEKYWYQVYGVAFSTVKKINTELTERLEKSGHLSSGVKLLLAQVAFEFLVSGDVWERTEERYLILAQKNLSRTPERLEIPIRTIQSIFRTTRKSPRKSSPPMLDLLIRFATSGVPERGGFPDPDRQTLRNLAEWVGSDKKKFSLRLGRILSVLEPRPTRYFLHYLEPQLPARIRSIFYLSNLFQNLFSSDLINDYRRQLNELLTSTGQDQDDWNYFSDQVVPDISARKGLLVNEAISRLEQAVNQSFYPVAGFLRTWLKKSSKKTPRGQRLNDPVMAWLFFLRTGSWSRRESPQVIFDARLKNGSRALIGAWREVSDLSLAWSRLLYQHQWDDVLNFLKLAYPDDAKIGLLGSRLKGSKDRQKVIQTFLQLRQNTALSPEEFRTEFDSQLKKRTAKSEVLGFDKPGDLPLEDLSVENYVRTFIHWIRFGTWLSSDLEAEGTEASIIRTRTKAADELMRQLRSQSDMEAWLRNLWVLLPVEEKPLWFDLLAPRFRDSWPSISQLAERFRMESADLFVYLVTLSMANMDAGPSDFRLDGLLGLLKLPQEEVSQVEWTKMVDPLTKEWSGIDISSSLPDPELIKTGIELDQQSDFSFPDLVRFILRHRTFPSWSAIYAPNQFAGLLIGLVRNQPAYWNQFFAVEFRTSNQLENFLSLLGTRRSIEILSAAWPAAAQQLKEAVSNLSLAHISLGPAKSITEYFESRMLKERYRDQAASWEEIVQHVLQGIGADFGLTIEDHRRLLSENQSPEESIRIFLNRPFEDPATNRPADTIFYLLFRGQAPWWAPQTGVNQIPELISEALSDNAQEFFKTVEQIADPGRFYRGIFSQIDAGLFLKMAKARFPDAVEALGFASGILNRWPVSAGVPGWFSFSWDFLKKSKWDNAVYATEFLNFLISVGRFEKTTALPQLLKIISGLEGNNQIRQIFKEASQAALEDKILLSVEEDRMSDSDWAILLKVYLQSGALPSGSPYRNITFSVFLEGIRGYLARNAEQAEQIIRNSWEADAAFNRLVRNESVEFLQLILQVTIGDRLRTLNSAWVSVQQFVESLYVPQPENTWSRAWSKFLIGETRSRRKLSSDDMLVVANFILLQERHLAIAAPLTIAQLLSRGLSEKLITELSEGGSLLLSGFSQAVASVRSLPKLEWESALRTFLFSGKWPTGFTVAQRMPLSTLLAEQSFLGTGALRQLLLRLLGDQNLWDALRKREDLESASALIGALVPADFLKLRNLGNQLIETLLRYWPVLPEKNLRWDFYRNLFDSIGDDSAPRLILARFGGGIVRAYGLDVTIFLETLHESGYPAQWIDGFITDAGFSDSGQIPTPVQLIAEKVAFYNPQSTLEHYLRTGSWPINVELADLDLPAFLSKARQQPAFRADAMFAVIRNALGNELIRDRIADQKNYNSFRAIRDFIFPKLSAELEILRLRLIRLLTRHQESRIVFSLNSVILELMSGSYPEYLPFEKLFYSVMAELKSLYGSDLFRRKDLISSDFPLHWIGMLERAGMILSGVNDPEDSAGAVTPGEADLVLHLLIERQVPWWGESFGVSDANEETIAKVLGKVLQIDPGSLVIRIQKEKQAEEIYTMLARHFDEADFFALVSVWGIEVKQVVIPFTRLNASVIPGFSSPLWYAFVAGYTANARSFDVNNFLAAALTFLSRFSGRSTYELYQILLTGGSDRFGSDRDVQKILHSINNIIEVPDADKDALMRTPLIDFRQVVLKYLRTGSVPPGMLPDIHNRAEFFQFLRFQLSFGNKDLNEGILKAIRESSTRERLLQNEKADLLGLVAQVLFPQTFYRLEQYRRQLYRFFRDQNQFLTEERFNQGFFGALLKHFGNQGSDADGTDKVLAFVLRDVKNFLQYNSIIRADSLRRFGFGDDTLNSLIKSDAGVEAGEEAFNKSEGLLEETVEVRNAGLVILWPFLTKYFDLLEMTEKGEFKTDDVASRAVLLLQYLATGRSAAAEHELLLNKVLCGLLPGLPVPREIELTQKEIDTSEMMFKGVLQNWEKLKNSSIDALREGFLIRDGYLREKEFIWEMKVEKKTLDILMQSMPWSFGTIKLPWMKKRLVVEWL